MEQQINTDIIHVNNISYIKNIILIDKTIKTPEIIFSSNNDETFPIEYNYHTDRDKLFEYLENEFIKIDRIAFIFDNSTMNNKHFLNNEPFFTENDIIQFENNKKYLENYSSNIKFIVKLCKTFNVKNLDFLACESLKYHNWYVYYEILKHFTASIIGASIDLTGNTNYEGNWVMENTNEDIQNIYFNKNINNYVHTLDFISNFTIIFKNKIFYGCGNNSFGQFGNGTITSSSSLVPVFTTLPIIYTFKNIKNILSFSSGSQSSMFLELTDNIVYCCGDNSYGQFGNGTTTSSSSFVPAFTAGYPTGKIVKKMFYGQYVVYLLFTDNTVYCCGNNLFGQFGNGTTTSSSSLVPAFTVNYPTGKTIYNIFLIYSTTYCLMTDNTVYCCGNNFFGQFGNGTTTSSSSLVPAFTVNYPSGKIIRNIYVMSSSIFLRMNDDTFYCCGNNFFGQFGNGTTTSSTSLVPAFTTLPIEEEIDKVILSRRFTLVYTYSKKFFICGSNLFGQFGNGTTTSSSSLIPAFTINYPIGKTVIEISLLDDTVYLLTNDGFVYCCGSNSSGQYGNGTTTSSLILINVMNNVFYMYNSTQLSSPNNISTSDELYFYLNTQIQNLNIANSLEIDYDLKTASSKILTGNNIIITKRH